MTMTIDDAVDTLWRSIQQGIHDPDALRGQLTMDQAYEVQLGLLARCEQAGDTLVGWKVGLTAKAIQEQVGYGEPVFAFLTQSAHRASGTTLPFNQLRSPALENELCLTIGQTLRGPVTFDQAKQAITTVAPAFEIIERRAGPPMDMALAMADNGQQKAFVVGEAVAYQGTDLGTVSADIFLNGAKQETANGAEVQGTPVASVQWLANKLAQFDRQLEAGQQVMSGSFTKQYDLSPDDHYQADFSGVGSVNVQVS